MGPLWDVFYFAAHNLCVCVCQRRHCDCCQWCTLLSQGVSKAVYRGVLDLLKYLLHSVEEDFTKESETPLFSAFLVFRLAFSLYHEPQTKSTLGFSLRSALSISTSLMATDSVKEPSSSPIDSPSQVPRYHCMETRNNFYHLIRCTGGKINKLAKILSNVQNCKNANKSTCENMSP